MKRLLPTTVLILAIVTLGGMSQDGCQSGTLPRLERPRPAIIVADAAPDSLSRNFTVDLRLYSDCETISWVFGDGASAMNLPRAAGENINHIYPNSGTFTVQVHLFSRKDPMDLSIRLLGTGELPVTVTGPNSAPSAAFDVRDALDANGDVVPRGLEFDGSPSADTDGDVVSFLWDFGDGFTSSDGVVVRHTYATTGRFTVTLTITDDRGATAVTQRLVTADIAPVADFTAMNVPDGNGMPQPFVFEFASTGSSDADGTIQAFAWNFGDGTAEATGATVQHTFSTPGEYDVTLTVTDDLGATGTKTTTVDATGTDPFISDIDMSVGEVGSTVTLAINGFNFTANPIVRLTSSMNPDITATSTTVPNERLVNATFDLTGAPTGLRSVVLTDVAALTSTLADSFRVVTPNRVRMITSMGDIVMEMNRTAAPISVTNFFHYIQDDFYDDTVFHRVVNSPNPFVIQGGAFESLGAGASPRLLERASDPPIQSEAHNGLSNIRGSIAMALRGNDANSASSQFFINLADNSFLDTGNPPFTVFGMVVDGMPVVDAIAAVQTGSAVVTILDANGNTMNTTFQDVPVSDVTVIDIFRE